LSFRSGGLSASAEHKIKPPSLRAQKKIDNSTGGPFTEKFEFARQRDVASQGISHYLTRFIRGISFNGLLMLGLGRGP
jgi:hypothetical protein